MIAINTDECVSCGGCIDLCPKTAIRMHDDKVFIDSEKCVECMICVKVCPVGAPRVYEQQQAG
jgi:ferredoxin